MSKKKAEQLGMPIGTAHGRLRKLVLFDLLKRHDENFCFHCGMEIENASELSIEHKIPWLDNSVELFWDMENIAFSHLSCNSAAGKKGLARKELLHGTRSMYKYRRCRCGKCTKANRNYIREWRM